MSEEQNQGPIPGEEPEGGPNPSEEIRTTGEQLLQKVKQLIREGNVRSITIKDKDGRVLFTIPMTIGMLGIALAPVWAAIGAAAALLTDCTISVERRI